MSRALLPPAYIATIRSSRPEKRRHRSSGRFYASDCVETDPTLLNAAPAWRSWVRGVFIAVVAVVALTFAPTSGPATAGLVAAFAFDEGSGSTVTDLSGTGNTGTISNATWTTAGKYGKALIFNGTNARVNVPDAASLHLTSAMTLEAWVNPSVVTRAWRDVIYKGDDNYYLEGTSDAELCGPGGRRHVRVGDDRGQRLLPP